MTKHEAYEAAIVADKAWHDLLVKYFGKNAGDVRYTKAGEGKEGSDLRVAYEAFRDISETWRNL